jgi:Ser/Thr protein kinase RdoA (MazF antagonist)
VAQHRPTLKPNYHRLEWIEKHIPVELWKSYRSIAEEVFEFLDSALPHFQSIRVHGDFHRGNLIWNEDWTLIDFDDFLMAPAAQDFWIILTQMSDEEQRLFVDSYRQLREWDEEEMFLLEPLRAYRIIHYSTWIAERWDDPSFPHLFPGFHDYNFWSSELLALQKIVDRA